MKEEEEEIRELPLGGARVLILGLGSAVEGDHGVSGRTRVRPFTSIPIRRQCVRPRLCRPTSPQAAYRHV